MGAEFAEGLSHDADLLAGDVVDVHEEALGVVLDGVTEVGPNSFLAFAPLLGSVAGHLVMQLK